ncbi:DUF362 domain-containing protein [Thermodesulfobacteriota bacterium]
MKIAISKAENYSTSDVKSAFDNLFSLLGFEHENPMGSIIKPGDTVFIKPNWVAHEYRKSCPNLDDVFCCITHPSIIRAMAEYSALALKGRGKIIIGDNPSIDADFKSLLELMNLGDLKTQFDVPCELLDLRPLICTDLKDYGKKSRMKSQLGDPEGTRIVNLGKDSMLYGINHSLLRGVFDDREETIRHHKGEIQEYGISNSILNADVYISIPKLKTHHKVGTTLNLKGLVGTNTIKNYIVHWRVGWPGIGGDEYPNFFSWLKSKTQKVVKRGAWPGNDTIWRMVVDLYNIFNQFGPKRKFTVIDGILGGQGNGPFCSISKHSEVMLAGEDLLASDIVASRLMGFDIHKIPYLQHILKAEEYFLSEIEPVSNQFDLDNFFNNANPYLAFDPPSMWQHIRISV